MRSNWGSNKDAPVHNLARHAPFQKKLPYATTTWSPSPYQQDGERTWDQYKTQMRQREQHRVNEVLTSDYFPTELVIIFDPAGTLTYTTSGTSTDYFAFISTFLDKD